MDEFSILMEAIYRGEYDSRPDIGDYPLSRADSAVVAVLRIQELRDGLHSLIAAAVGGGNPVDAVALVHEQFGGDWSKAVAFACEAIAVNQGRHTRPAEQRGTTLSDPDRRGV